MNTYRKFCFLVVIMGLLVAACTPQAASTPNATSAPVAAAGPDKPITLRLGVSDEQGYPSEPYVLELADQVKNLSNGSITIEPVWNAGNQTDSGFESGVIQLVKKGDFDLGLAASRAFLGEGISSFQALQAPFLIDNNALAEAVATSDIATKMLDHLASTGLTGLTLWPEDLRHPFSTLPDKPILSPADFSGRNIRVTDQGMAKILIEALGGIPMTGDGGYEGAESGLRQGRSLTGTPTATGNITFFPKYQVLFANDVAFKNLSNTQRSVLKDAALATQKKVIAEHPSEAEAGQAWCADGRTIVLATEEQVANFETAAQPVYDAIAQNPSNADLIAAIRELKAKIAPSPGAAACEPETAQPGAEPGTNTQVWSEGLPPNGVWQVQLTSEDVIQLGVSKTNAPDWSGIFTHTFKDGVFHTTWEGTEGQAKGQTGSCDGTYEAVEDFVRITLSNDCGSEVDDIQWRLDPDGLHFNCIAVQNGMSVEVKAIFNAKPYQKIADP